MTTNTGITIYNKYLNPVTRTDAYKRTYIPSVFYAGIDALIRVQAGANKDDKIYVSIPFQSVNLDKYLEPKDFRNHPDKEMYFTLSPGDRLVKGFVELEIIQGISELDKLYDALTITSVSTRDYGSRHLRHWGVTAK